MSYKHLDQIRDLYESVNDIENRDNELVNEIITVISTSMFVEGYTNVAIKNYFDCADPVEIFEKYEEYSKDFLFVDEKTLNESVEHDLVLDEESIKELNLIIEKLGVGSLVRGLKKVAAPHLAGIKTASRKALKSDNPVMKKIYAAKDGIKNKIKKVSTKSNQLELPLSKNTSAKDTVSNTTKTVKDKSKEIFDKSKKVLGSEKTKKTIGKIGKILKPTTKRGFVVRAAAGLGGAGIISAAGGDKKDKKPETKSTTTPDTKKSETDTKEPRYDLSGVKGVDKGDAKSNTSDTKEKKTSDIGSQIYNNAVKISQSQAKPAPSKPSTASGKETPKPRAIGKGKGEINPNSARGRMIAKNQERFGKDRIQKLRDKNAAFQAARKKGSGYSMDDFVKDFPDSNTAKDRAKRKKTPSVMDYESYVPYEPYDLVLEYLLSTEQADTIEEANYIMTEMDAETIQGIVSEGLGSAIKKVVKKGMKKLKGGEMKGDFPDKGDGSYTA